MNLEQTINSVYSILKDTEKQIENKRYTEVYCNLSYYSKLMEKYGGFIYSNYNQDYNKIKTQYISILEELNNFEVRLRGDD